MQASLSMMIYSSRFSLESYLHLLRFHVASPESGPPLQRRLPIPLIISKTRETPKGWEIYWTTLVRCTFGSIKIYYIAINANYYDVSITFCDEESEKNLPPALRTLCGRHLWDGNANHEWCFRRTKQYLDLVLTFRLLTPTKWKPLGHFSAAASKYVKWKKQRVDARVMGEFYSHVAALIEYHL